MHTTPLPLLVLGALAAAAAPALAASGGYCAGSKYAVVKDSETHWFTMHAGDEHCSNADTGHPEAIGNPCTSGYYACSPDPVTITRAYIDGQAYDCSTDVPAGGACLGGFTFNVVACCG